MPFSQSNFVGAAADQGTNWTGTGNVSATDGSTATLTGLPTNNGEVLRCTMAANAFTVAGTPPTIRGVVVDIVADYSDAFGGTVSYSKVQLVNGGVNLGVDRSASTPVNSATPATNTFGSSNDLWGASLTAAIVNSSTFGVDIAFADSGSGPGQVNVDSVKVTVYYDTGAIDVLTKRNNKLLRSRLMGYFLLENSTEQPLLFKMISSTDHLSPVTGITPTVTISKNGGAFAAAAGAVTEIANGWYKVAGNATDTNTLGPLLLHATGTGADDWDDVFEVVAFDPQDGLRLGLSTLPGAAANAVGGMFTRGTGAGQINQNANGQIDVRAVDASAAALATFFTVNSGETYGAAVAGSVVKEIATNAAAGASFPANFASMRITASGDISLGEILGTGLTEASGAGHLAASFTKFFDVAGPLYTINNIDDAYTRIGVGGVGLTNLGDTRLSFLDAAVSSRLPTATYVAPLSSSATASAVLDATLASHLTAGSVGAALNSASSAGNPWTDTLTTYTAGQAGYIVKNFLTGDSYGKLTDGTIGLAAIEGLLTNATYGLSALQVDISGLHNIQATDVWAAATRTLTSVDKTGYTLASNGLDAVDITPPSGGTGWNFRQYLVMLGRRFFKKNSFNKSTGNMISYADDGVTAISTQVLTDDGTTQTEGAAS